MSSSVRENANVNTTKIDLSKTDNPDSFIQSLDDRNNINTKMDKSNNTGGNIVTNPNLSLFRDIKYAVLTNEQTVDINICEPKSRLTCDLPFEEPPLKLFRRCSGCINKMDLQFQRQKVIDNQVRRNSSLQTSIIASNNYCSDSKSVTKRNVPTRGNSTKYSITALKPGSMSARGKGVHVKHASYQRRMLNLKQKCLN
jgi:hypothetical protein